MLFHDGRRVVLFGGLPPGQFSPPIDRMWEWTGADWRELQIGNRPSPRFGSGVVLDPVRQHVVLYGGRTRTLFFRDTWIWDGQTWTEVQTPRAPGNVSPSLAWDAVDQRILALTGSVTFTFDGSDWIKLADGAPEPRSCGRLAYDRRRQQVVMFSGDEAKTDTWGWDGAWHQHEPATHPPERILHGLVYDDRRAVTVCFGGVEFLTGIRRGDTWEWDGAQWTQRQPAASPSPRDAFAMAYDEARGVTVLFGGDFDETWEYDGTTWRPVPTANSPGARRHVAMAYDRARGVMTLFGGQTGGTTPAWDTWEYDGTDWTRRTPAQWPPPRFHHAMTYDPLRRRVIVHGGRDAGVVLTDTWEWDGSTWRPRLLTSVVGERYVHGMTFHDGLGKVVLYGGLSRRVAEKGVFLYGSDQPAETEEYGAACAGPSGRPRLATTGGELPWAGGNLALEVAPVAGGWPAAVWLGASRSSWSGLPLPFDLGLYGMPGCWLHAALQVTCAASPAGGTARWSLPIPLLPELLGAELYAQAATVDLAANRRGLLTSNGLRARIGGR